MNLERITRNDIGVFSFENNNLIKCKVIRVLDGDTIHIVFLYKDDFIRLVCRLTGIDTPEISKNRDSALKSRNRLIQLCTNCSIALDNDYSRKDIDKLLDDNTKILDCILHGPEKYGRQLIELFDNGDNINMILVGEGYAHEYNGGTKELW